MLAQEDPDWQLGTIWEFKAKVSTEQSSDLEFGFPGGDGGFLKFTIPKNSLGSDAVVKVTDKVRATAENVEIEYRGSRPPAVTHPTTISAVCLRPRLCSDFSGCLPSSKWRPKSSGTGETLEECCEPVLCKEELLDGCNPSTQWKPAPDFDTKQGNTRERCCVAQTCTDKICSSGKYTPKKGTGLLGTTEEECCDKLFCSSYPDVCDPKRGERLPDVLEDGTPRLGSEEIDCCNVSKCEDFDCLAPAGKGLWKSKEKPSGIGETFEKCCDEAFCKDVSCANNTKWGPEDSGAEQGSSPENCCKPRFCKDYECSKSTLRLLTGDDRQGSTDGECCTLKRCEDYQCSKPTQYEKLPAIEETEDGLQIARPGYSDEECCTPKYCKNFFCTSTKWAARTWDKNDTTMGGTFEECCDEVFCADYNCTSDYDGDGIGTMYNRKKDSKAIRWQGSTDEECCEPRNCKDYTTQFPTKWTRKAAEDEEPRLGSTDAECYEPLLCKDFCGCKDAKKQLIKNAAATQGSTVEECCEAVPEVAAQ